MKQEAHAVRGNCLLSVCTPHIARQHLATQMAVWAICQWCTSILVLPSQGASRR